MTKFIYISLLLILTLPVTLRAQIPACDSIIINKIGFAPFTSSNFEIDITNNSTEIFNYPGFILFNAAGDTLAKDSVNFYAFVGSQLFYPYVFPGVEISGLPFSGRLELWTGFYTDLACSFNLEVDPCPHVLCFDLNPYMGNFGNGLAITDVQVNIINSQGATVFNNEYTLDSTHQAFLGNCCLPADTYQVVYTHSAALIEGQSLFGIHAGNWQTPHPEYNYANNGLNNTFSFTLYSECLDVYSVKQPDLSNTQPNVFVSPNGADVLQWPETLSTFEIIDVNGRLLYRSPRIDGPVSLKHPELKPGLYFLRFYPLSPNAKSIKCVVY